MLPSYVLLDLETTGATPVKDRITEIALIRFEQGVEVARWQTLVNPETPIPPFIQNLTGISNEMVADAPKFAEVADQLLAYLEGAVLAAHNVRFDHGFLKNELKRIGIVLRQKVLCTVKLSRKLYPQYHTHGLDAIIQRHGIVCGERHRAMGDVEVMRDFLTVAEQELGIDTLRQTVETLMRGPTIPSGVDLHLVDELPETPGVYLFYGENQLPLYIGKSVNLRARVLSHFSGDHASTKEMRIGQELKHMQWFETAGDFSALLLESRLVKTMQPIYNRRLRNERQLCSWKLADSPTARPLLTLVREDDIDPSTLGQLFGTFKTKKQATEALRQIAENHQLCPKCLGLESGKGPCLAFQLRRCKGVCADKEAPEIHYLRLQQAMAAHRLRSWPFEGHIAIREQDPTNGITELHVFDQWCHLASVKEEEALNDALTDTKPLAFDLDTYKLLLKVLKQPNTHVIKLNQTETSHPGECNPS